MPKTIHIEPFVLVDEQGNWAISFNEDMGYMEETLFFALEDQGLSEREINNIIGRAKLLRLSADITIPDPPAAPEVVPARVKGVK